VSLVWRGRGEELAESIASSKHEISCCRGEKKIEITEKKGERTLAQRHSRSTVGKQIPSLVPKVAEKGGKRGKMEALGGEEGKSAQGEKGDKD